MNGEEQEGTLVVAVTSVEADMPAAVDVERLYAAASASPPLSERPEVARMFARLYDHARSQPGAIAVSARRSTALVGFAYGHAWRWQWATDSWSRQLGDRLGADAALLEDTFAVALLAVSPGEARAGLGRRLLETLLAHDDHAVAWLQTTDFDSPARRLYERCGWTALGHGPDAPNGAPGLVMVSPSPNVRRRASP